MFYDYYYKVDGVLRRHTSSEELSDEQISSVFGSQKKVVLLEPVVFERSVIVDEKAKTIKEHVGFIGYVE
ncbi:hypothetical protein GAP32_433 [Cronobacter phage vB_CsaM_GAP32]|uniref:Uncharacterized protein n=1 Tax=Cronobacter phage vB_CsaM_GAP32 TaxID=1141136 RepID=K4F7R8_9CAUD|nr:hypothetical protein GAP32_433 [Cronobacter phage vB_CsaM_GAP32]AFC21887.1 hypothetical protein GAP32_433 [Cronobacter phage vB_CsaM_GAP32]